MSAGGAFTRAVRPGETPAEKGQATLEREARSTDRRVLMEDRKALNKMKNALDWVDRTPEEKAAVLTQLSEIETKLGGYRTVQPKEKPAAPSASAGVRLRRKSDGKTMLYKGNKADVPTGEFEIIE